MHKRRFYFSNGTPSLVPMLQLGNVLPRGYWILTRERDVRESLVVHSNKPRQAFVSRQEMRSKASGG